MLRRRFDLTDKEWSVIEPLLPRNSRGVARVDDRRVINGILWRFRTGSPWADIAERYGPHTTCYNRFVRWARAGVWQALIDAVSGAYDGEIQMIDSSSIRVHQHGGNAKKRRWFLLHGPFPGWADDKDSCSSRCQWPANKAGLERGAGLRWA